MVTNLLETIIVWLHLMATIAWIGGMFTNFFMTLPSFKSTLELPMIGKVMAVLMKRFRVMAYIALLILVCTGIYMFWKNPFNLGFVNFGNSWGIVMFVKQSLVAILFILTIYAFEILAPKVGKLAAQGPSPAFAKMQKLQMNVGLTGFIIGITILLLTAMLYAISR